MVSSRNILFGVFGVLLIVAIVYYSRGSADPAIIRRPPEKLASEALTSSDPVERQQAAVQLADQSKTNAENSPQQLRQVFRESESSEVRAACVSGMAQAWQYDNMSELLSALEDESPLVRGRAGAAVQRMLGIDFYFRAMDPPEKREAAIQHMRAAWQTMQNSGKLDEWIARQPSSP